MQQTASTLELTASPTAPAAPSWRWLLAAVFAFQVAVAAVFPVLPEEAYHWNFGRHLDYGYYDHPPMVPWAIELGRTLLGDTALGIRAVTLLFALGTSALLARLARRMYGEAAAFWAVLLYALQPAAVTVGSWGFPDSPVLFFWALTLNLVWQALETRQPAWWLAAGAALGAGMLSKYTAAFLVPSIFVYLLLSKRDRHWLWSPWPTLGGVCSLIVFSPVIYWNATHEWVSFRFQSTARFQAANGMSLGNGLQASLEQWLLVLPFSLPFAAVIVGRLVRSSRPADRFLLCTFAPMAAFFFVLGWTPSWHMLWSLPAYQALTVAMAGGVSEIPGGIAAFFRRWWPAFAALEACVVVTAVVHGTLVVPMVTPLHETYGWDEVGARCAALEAGLPEGSFYLATGRRPYPPASQLAFHLRAPFQVYGPSLIGQEALQYRYWAEPARLAGKDAVIVVEGGAAPDFAEKVLRQYFRSVEPAGEVDVPVGRLGTPRRSANFTLFVAHGYQPPAR